jgi:hypothetical protein
MPAGHLTPILRLFFLSSPRCTAGRLVLALALLALPLFSIAAQADVGDVLKAIQKDGHARIVMRMRSAHMGWNKDASVGRQAAAVEVAASEAEPALEAAHVRHYRHFRTLPYLAADVDREQLLALAASPAVESIQLVTIERQQATSGFEKPQLTTSVSAIDAPNAWAQGYDGTGYAIAVIDGGFKLTHPMLAGKTVAEGCFSHSFGTTVTSECPSGVTPQTNPGAASNCPTGSARCDHGTHVASIAVGNDGTNFGVARGAKLVALDVFSADNDPADCSPDPVPCEITDSLAVLDALDYVNAHSSDYNIASVNISVGGSLFSGYCDDDPRKVAIDALHAKGIAVAIAAGNEGATDKVDKPGCISTAETVGASDDATAVPSFSNFSTMVDFMAPGVNVLAANSSGTGLVAKSGTSIAAPHVAGAWAIMRQAFPTGSFDLIETSLKQTGVPISRAGVSYTIPKIQVSAAISQLKGRNRGIINGVASAANTSVGLSYMRFFNKSSTPGAVTISMRDAPTGTVYGTWTSPTIPPGASLQFGVGQMEREAVPTGPVLPILGRTFYDMDVTSTFAGYVQHVQWANGSAILNNLTSCGTGIVNDTSVITNIYTSKIGSYVSHVRMVNTGALADHAVLVVTDINGGTQIGQWTSPEIPSGGMLDITGPQLEAQIPALQTAVIGGMLQYNVTLTRLAGYMQHIMENQGADVISDMTAKCSMTVVAPPAVTAAK